MKRIAVVLLAVIMLCGLVLPGVGVFAEPGTSAPQLKTQGNRVVNASTGEEVLLRGVNVPCLGTWPVNEHITESLDEMFNRWNANIIRFPVNLTCWNGEYEDNFGFSQNGDPTGYKELIKDTVRRVMAAGKYIIIDLHEFHDFTDRMADFWAEVAADPFYQNNPSVLFNLMNEPTCSAEDVVAGNQRLIEVIRDAGAKNILLCGGRDYAYDLRPFLETPLADKGSDAAGGPALAGYGIIYDTHIYPMKGDVASWEANVGQMRRIAPVFAGEFGWDSSNSVVTGNSQDIYNGYMPKLLDWMDAGEDCPAMGWTAWSLHPANSPKLITSWDFTPTYNFGRFIKEKLTGQPSMEPEPGDADVLFDLGALTKVNGAGGYWPNSHFTVTVEEGAGYQGGQALHVDHDWGTDALYGGFSSHRFPAEGNDFTGGRYLSFLLKGDGNPQRAEINIGGTFGSASLPITIAEGDTGWHQYIYSFAELGIIPEYGDFGQAVQNINFHAGERNGNLPGVYSLCNLRVTAEKPPFEGTEQAEKKIMTRLDSTDSFRWQEGGIARSVAAGYGGKAAKLTYLGGTGRWISADTGQTAAGTDRLVFMAKADTPQRMKLALVDRMGYEAVQEITVAGDWQAYSLDIREFLLSGAPIAPDRITGFKLYNMEAQGSILLSEIGFANRQAEMTPPVYDETDHNIFAGTVPRDSVTGEILFAGGSGDRVHYAEDSADAWRVSLAEGVSKHSVYGDLLGGAKDGNFAIQAPLSVYQQGKGYVQFDFGTQVTLDQLQVSFGNSTDPEAWRFVPKAYRVDHSADGVTWTEGPVQSNDFSKPEDAGELAAEIYGRIDTATALEKSALPAGITYLFAERLTGRYFRFVIVNPTQDDGQTMPAGNRLTLRGLRWFDLAGLADVNRLPEDGEVPLNPYNGMVEFRMAREESNPGFDDSYVTRLANEEIMPPDAIRVSRSSYSAPGGTDWYPRHIFANDNFHQQFGLRGGAADYMQGNVWLQMDLGKNTAIDRITISSINQGSSFQPVYTGFEKLPKRLRVDTGAMDAYGRISWTRGVERVFDLSDPGSVGEELAQAYARVRDLDPAVYGELDAKGDGRTAEEQAVWEAYRKIPTLTEISLDRENPARYYRVVILEPCQQQLAAGSSYQFDFYNIRYMDSERASITHDWDSARLIQNVYASGVVRGSSLFDGETNYTNNEGADKALDTNGNTQWFNGNNNYPETRENGLAAPRTAWLVVDLGQEYDITGYRLICNNTGYRPLDYRVQSGALTGEAEGETHREKGINIITQAFADEAVMTYPETTASQDIESVRSGAVSFRARYVRLYIDVTRRWRDPTESNPGRMSMDGNTTVHGFCLYGTPAGGDPPQPEEPEVRVTGVTVTGADGRDMQKEGLTAGSGQVTVRLKNTGEEAGLPACAAAALYDQGTDQLVQVWSRSAVVPFSKQPAELNIPVEIPEKADMENYCLKVFVWRDVVSGDLRTFDKDYPVVSVFGMSEENA